MTVYLKAENRKWLEGESNRTGVSMSSLMNMFVSEKREKSPYTVREVNLQFENARLSDLEKEV